MPARKKFPKDGMPRRRGRTRQSPVAKKRYGKGFNVRGIPTTCGVESPTGGYCAAYSPSGDMCDRHWDEWRRRQEKRRLEERGGE